MRVSMKLKQSVNLPDGSTMRVAVHGDLDPVTGILMVDEEQPGGRRVKPGTFIHIMSLCTGVRLDQPAAEAKAKKPTKDAPAA